MARKHIQPSAKGLDFLDGVSVERSIGLGDGEPDVAAGSAGHQLVDVVPRDHSFDHAVKGDSDVELIVALARARADVSQYLNPNDKDRRAVGDRYFYELQDRFMERNPHGRVASYWHAQIGVCLTSDGEVLTVVFGETINFDWSDAQSLITRLDRHTDEVRTWIAEKRPRARRTMRQKLGGLFHRDRSPDGARDGGAVGDSVAHHQSDLPANERTMLLMAAFGLATHVAGAINDENRRHPTPPAQAAEASTEAVAPPKPTKAVAPPKPTKAHLKRLKALGTQIEGEESRFAAAAERQAIGDYADGMLRGVLAMAFVTIIIFVSIHLAHAPAFYGIAVPAGALGATISVLQRMSKSKLKVEYRTERNLLHSYGAVRPFVGAVFGALIFAIFEAGLLTVIKLPTDNGALIAWYAVFGFLAGFSERFAPGMLEGVTNLFPAGVDRE